MTRHKTLPFLTLLGLLALGALAGWTSLREPARYTFTAESTMHVEGTSTIHAWQARVRSLSGSMELAPGAALQAGGTLAKGRLTIPVSALDCDNATMNKKLREALQAERHEAITFELVRARSVGAPGGTAFGLVVAGRLRLAGVEKPVEVKLEGQALGGGRLRLKGSHALQMSDYGIKPPTAMMGTLKTGDRVVIHFDLAAAEEPAL